MYKQLGYYAAVEVACNVTIDQYIHMYKWYKPPGPPEVF